MTPSFINPVPQSPMTDHPIRPAFWNVPLWGEIGVYVLGFTAVALLIAGILRNRRLWQIPKFKVKTFNLNHFRLQRILKNISNPLKNLTVRAISVF